MWNWARQWSRTWGGTVATVTYAAFGVFLGYCYGPPDAVDLALLVEEAINRTIPVDTVPQASLVVDSGSLRDVPAEVAARLRSTLEARGLRVEVMDLGTYDHDRLSIPPESPILKKLMADSNRHSTLMSFRLEEKFGYWAFVWRFHCEPGCSEARSYHAKFRCRHWVAPETGTVILIR